MKEQFENPIVVHIPHSQTVIPPSIGKSLLLSDDELNAELLLMTDRYVDVLWGLPATKIIFPVSRLVCDVERFRSDSEEAMSRVGMGAVYTHTSSGKILRKLSAKQRDDILRDFYDAHHRAFGSLVAQKLSGYNKCLIIDAHSFCAKPLPHEPDASRPDFCIGSDFYHTPLALSNALSGLLSSLGYSVKINSPFSGSIVPIEYYNRDKRVFSVMLEINRRLYMNDDGTKNSGFSKLQSVIYELHNCCLDFLL